MMEKAQLKQYQAVDIHTVSREILADLSAYRHSNNQNREKNITRFETSMKNPYLFTSSDMIIKLYFDDAIDINMALAKGLCG